MGGWRLPAGRVTIEARMHSRRIAHCADRNKPYFICSANAWGFLQDSAVAGMKSLDAMLNWVVKRKGGRAVVGQAIEALREVFLTALLPDRKLRFLSQQPLRALAAGREGERRLLYWHLEDCIKKRCAAWGSTGGLRV